MTQFDSATTPNQQRRSEAFRSRELANVYRNLESQLPASRKVVLFTGPDEATTQVALEFAATCVNNLGKSVVLVGKAKTGGQQIRQQSGSGDESAALSPVSGYPFLALPFPGDAQQRTQPGWSEFFRDDVPDVDLVVCNLPGLTGSRGISSLFTQVHGCILVAEADKTLLRDTGDTKDSVLSAGGKVLGVIVVNERDYIPNWLDKIIG